MKNSSKVLNEEIINHTAPRKRGARRETLSIAEMPLLFLVPLIETAWAHGAIAKGEKQMIFAFAREEEIDEKHLLNETLDELLVYQPRQQFFDDCLSQIKSELAAMTVKQRESRRSKLIDRCRQIAAAAGGNSVMDVGKSTSPEELEVLERIASEIDFREESPRIRRRATTGLSG